MNRIRHGRTLRAVVQALIISSVVALLGTCTAADALIGIHTAFLPGNNQVPVPTVTVAASSILVGESTTLSAAGSGNDAVYHWSVVSGDGSIDETGETVSYTASSTPGSVIVSVHASATGYQDSDAAEATITVSDLPLLTAPVISFDDGTSTVLAGDTVNISASGSGTGVTYTWSVTGAGSIGPTGDTVSYVAPASEETVTVSVYASAAGYNDSPVTSATITVKENHFALLRYTDTVTNINQALTIPWTNSTLDSTYFDNSTSTVLKVLQSGDYFLSLTIPMMSSLERPAVRAQLFVNGIAHPGAIADSSYIRNNTGNHSESSDHLAILLDGLSAGDTIEVRLTAAALVGSSVTVTDQATLYAEYVEPSRTIFSATSTTTTAGTNLNQGSEYPLIWSASVADTGFTHSGTQDITLESAGYYLVFANLPTAMGFASTARFSIEMQVKLDGTTVGGGYARQGYIRNQNGHDSASIHWSGLVHSTAANEVLTITAQREPSMTTAGTVDFGGNEATIFIEKIDPSAFIYSGEAVNPVSGTDWNSPGELAVSWSAGDSLIDTATYSHSTSSQPQEVTFTRSGDYLVIYNDALFYTGPVQGTDYRFNPRIKLKLDGSPVTGAQTKTHYIRNDATGNARSSASLVFYLAGVSAGQVLTVTTQQEAMVSGIGYVVIADDRALLTLVRKQ